MLLSHEKYSLKLAETSEEKDQIYALRYNIFNEELGEGIRENEKIRRDIDEFDPHCDHLMLMHSGKLIGTYRILPFSKRPGKFYTETEFDLRPLYPLGDHLAELGRGCVHPDHRLGAGFTLMWAGLYEYCSGNGIQYLVGCASILKKDAPKVSGLYTFLREKGHLHPELTVRPLDSTGFSPGAAADESGVSPILRMYLRIGAKVLGPPCWDPVFGCYDFPAFFTFTEDVPYMRVLRRFLDTLAEEGREDA